MGNCVTRGVPQDPDWSTASDARATLAGTSTLDTTKSLEQILRRRNEVFGRFPGVGWSFFVQKYFVNGAFSEQNSKYSTEININVTYAAIVNNGI